MLQTWKLTRMFVKYLVISVTLAFSIAHAQTCPQTNILSPSNYAILNQHAAGDDPKHYLYIGGLFGSHYAGGGGGMCGGVRTRGIHNLEAFFWAVKTYKDRHPGSLTGIKIGAIGFDSCSSAFHLQQQLANFRHRLVGYGEPAVDPDTVYGFIGPDRSDDAISISSYFGENTPPFVSHSATSGVLSDKSKYPRFLRTVPSDVLQVDVLVKILTAQNWKYVQLVYVDNAYGKYGRDAFVAAANSTGICIVHERPMPAQADDREGMNSVVDNLLKNADTRAVVVFATDDYSRALLDAVGRSNARGKFTWYGTTSWGGHIDVVRGVEEMAEGAVTMSLEPTPISDDYLNRFKGYFSNLNPRDNKNNPWIREYWSATFECYFLGVPNPKNYQRLCDDMSVSLSSTELDVYVPYTIKAVDAVLDGVDKARRLKCASSPDELCPALTSGDKWKTIWENVLDNFKVFNTTTGEPISAIYDVFNFRIPGTGCSKHCYELIGGYSTNTGTLTVEVTKIHIYNSVGIRLYNATSVCTTREPYCAICGETPLPVTTRSLDTTSPTAAPSEVAREIGLRTESWVIPLIVLGGIGVLLVISFEIFLLSKICASTYMKHWRTMWLGQLLLVGILLSYLTLIPFVITPTKATCGIIRFGVGVSYAMCFSVLLVKLMILLSSESFGELKGAFQVMMFLFAWGVQIVIDTEWLILRFPEAVPSDFDPSVYICQHADFVSHVESLIYVMVLIVICLAMAIRTSRISTNHREAIFIALCAAFTIPIWLIWIILGILKYDPAYHDPCIAYGLLATATIILFIMFLPKVRQLNSMGVEGIYAEDDSPDYSPSVEGVHHGRPSSVMGYSISKGGNHSVIGYPIRNGPPSVIGYPSKNGPPSVIGYSTGDGSVILLPDADMYNEPVKLKPIKEQYQNALYLKHPGSQNTLRINRNADATSVRSAPIGNEYVLNRRPQQINKNPDTIRATTRVLRVTNDLTGRKTPVLDRRANSDMDYYGDDGNKTSNNYRSPEMKHVLTDMGTL